jgi:hypothetical protein
MVMAESLERRVHTAAQAQLASKQFVAPIEVLTGFGWLRPEHAEAWRRGRVPHLERVTVASLGKLSTALRILRRWAEQNGLQPRETVYVAWTPRRQRLRFTKTGDENLERAYRTHWISPKLAAAKHRTRQGLASPPPGYVQAGQDGVFSDGDVLRVVDLVGDRVLLGEPAPVVRCVVRPESFRTAES